MPKEKVKEQDPDEAMEAMSDTTPEVTPDFIEQLKTHVKEEVEDEEKQLGLFGSSDD